VRTGKKIVRARYEFADAGAPTLGSFIDAFLEQHPIRRP
jgi:hypothetical protein